MNYFSPNTDTVIRNTQVETPSWVIFFTLLEDKLERESTVHLTFVVWLSDNYLHKIFIYFKINFQGEPINQPKHNAKLALLKLPLVICPVFCENPDERKIFPGTSLSRLPAAASDFLQVLHYSLLQTHLFHNVPNLLMNHDFIDTFLN